MKRLFVISIALLIGSWCYSQEIELNGSLNTSSEIRLQSAAGIGVQYQNDLGRKFKIGIGMQYISNSTQFDDIPHIDANPQFIVSEKINSNSHRVSFRLNIQGMLINNEYVSLSLGPEVSYNYLWGKDQVEFNNTGLYNNWTKYSQNNGTAKSIGFGLISKVEVKHFLAPPLSLCFTIRSEFITDGQIKEAPVFSGVITFAEFQIGLKYRFKK